MKPRFNHSEKEARTGRAPANKPNLRSGGLRPRRHFRFAGEHAFTRTDLLAIVVVVVILGGLLGQACLGETGRSRRCAANLSVLGRAMQDYVDQHNGALPAASIDYGTNHLSWDTALRPYLHAGQAGTEKYFTSLPRFFLCPSDNFPHSGTPRSYAMAGNDMWPDHWPPGPHSPTGVGLWWIYWTMPPLLGDKVEPKMDQLPVVKLSDIPHPDRTVLLTEFIDAKNTVGNTWQATVYGASQQLEFFTNGGASFHHGKFNYLMADGHVEALAPLQTGGLDTSAGIWSMNKQN